MFSRSVHFSGIKNWKNYWGVAHPLSLDSVKPFFCPPFSLSHSFLFVCVCLLLSGIKGCCCHHTLPKMLSLWEDIMHSGASFASQLHRNRITTNHPFADRRARQDILESQFAFGWCPAVSKEIQRKRFVAHKHAASVRNFLKHYL